MQAQRPVGVYGDRHGRGAFVRKVTLSADGTTVRGDVQDDMHHFVVELHHDHERVLDVVGLPVRWPWTLCLESPAELRRLTGTRLDGPRPRLDVRQQCTHQYDLALWCLSFAGRAVRGGPSEARYVARVPDWHQPPFTATLEHDGEVVLDWVLDGERIIAPESFAGVTLKGFSAWAEANLAPELADGASILRRAVWLSPARRSDLEACRTIADSGIRGAVCFTTQPQRVEIARRNYGSLRNLSG